MDSHRKGWKSMRKLLKRNEVIAIRRQYAAGRTYAWVKDVLVPPLPEPLPRFRVPVARGGHPGARPKAAPKPAAPRPALADPLPAQPSGLAAALAAAAQQQAHPSPPEPPASDPAG